MIGKMVDILLFIAEPCRIGVDPAVTMPVFDLGCRPRAAAPAGMRAGRKSDALERNRR